MSRQFEIGDVVVVYHGHLTGRSPEVSVVDAVTQTLVFVNGSYVRYSRTTGKQVGTCKLSRIELAPEEKLEEFRKRIGLHKKIRQTNWNKISTEVMEKVVDLVSPSGSEVSPKDNRYTLTLEHMPNLWLRNGYHGAKPLGNNPKYVKVNSLENASKVFSEWVINNNLGTGNLTVFSGTLVNSDNILVARIAINGKVFGLDGICIYTP